MEEIKTEYGQIGGVYTDYVENEYGNKIILPVPGFLVDHIFLFDNNNKGKGYGKELYLIALKKYKTLYHHWPISKEAYRVYTSLENENIITQESIELENGISLLKTDLTKKEKDKIGRAHV